ncbi:MAG: T9SS type A sorting domain-containing protein [Bacteroidales bacterium]|nr:T9SS type A sorting domain-containing protein [Bacteroidales bacterium]
MFKKLVTAVLLIGSFLCNAQVYQLSNGGFEEWETVNYNGKTGDEPLHWNSFITSSGQFSGVGANQIFVSDDVRPGSTGIKSIKTTARDVMLGIIANGTFTTGQINIGSISMTDPANHNITHTAEADFRQPLNAKPDSIVFWAKFVCPSATQEARMSATIHDNYDYMDPDSFDPEAPSHKVGGAVLNFTTGNGAWTRYAVPFNYDFPATTPEYILISFATNAIAGSGSVDDALFVDDIMFTYNADLSDLQIDGTTIEGFDAHVFNYSWTAECDAVQIPQVSATAVSSQAVVSVEQATFSQPIATVSVTSGDQTKNYAIHFTFPTSFEDVVEISICENQLPFTFGGETFYEAGTYGLTFQTVQGCDSVITLTLSVGNEYTETLHPHICEGETFEFLDSIYSESGVYTYTITSSEGCDSVFTIDLSVHPNQEVFLYDTVMQGEFYTENGFNLPPQTELGTFDYQLNISTIFGCDSIVNLSLTVIENTAVVEIESSDVQLYPNPASEMVHITSLQPILQIEIFDIAGRKVKEIVDPQVFVSLEGMVSGIYMVRVKTNSNIVFKKLIIR